MFPTLLEFPFARAREIALSGMRELSLLPDAAPLALENLPWQDEESPAEHSSRKSKSKPLSFLPPAIPKRRFRITQSRVATYGPTDGCPGCEAVRVDQIPKPHSPACIERFESPSSIEPGPTKKIIEEKPTASEPARHSSSLRTSILILVHPVVMVLLRTSVIHHFL